MQAKWIKLDLNLNKLFHIYEVTMFVLTISYSFSHRWNASHYHMSCHVLLSIDLRPVPSDYRKSYHPTSPELMWHHSILDHLWRQQSQSSPTTSRYQLLVWVLSIYHPVPSLQWCVQTQITVWIASYHLNKMKSRQFQNLMIIAIGVMLPNQPCRRYYEPFDRRAC